jgi:hypothetical protein
LPDSAVSQEAPLDPLTRLAIRYGTDKWGQHLYTPTYHRVFASLRETPVSLLEIGVGWPTLPMVGGASLRMWRDYFPFGRIVGLDVQPKRLDLGPRVTVVQGSQSDATDLRALWQSHGPFDIVIDDGSHRVDDVLLSFDTLFPLLPTAGLYAVEDTQTSFWPEFGGCASGNGTIVARVTELMKAMHAQEARAAGLVPVSERYGELVASVQIYRNMVVVERGRNEHPSNRALDVTHPAFLAILERLRAENARDPSDGAAMVHAGLLDVAGDLPGSLAAVQEGLAAHPLSLDLLCMGLYLTTRLALRNDSQAILERLMILAPNEPIFEKLRAQLP